MDLVRYLESLPAVTLPRLYESPFTCQALLRSLPVLPKQYVMRLLLEDAGVPAGVLASWPLPSALSKHEAALDKLRHLRLLESRAGKGGEAVYVLEPSFRQQLRSAVCTGLAAHRRPVPERVAAAAPHKTELGDYARDQWEKLLLFMVGTSSEPPALPRELRGKGLDVLQLLTSAGLVIKDELSGRPGVSEGGFQFLLIDTYSQLWTLLREYISRAERTSNTELASVISFLLQLGLQGQQQCMQLKALRELEQTFASQVAQLGLLKPFLCGGEVWLCPTRLAAIMAGGQGGRAAAAEDGFIIIETNYRVYAYTISPVQQSILRLFVRCEVLLPNLFVGSITRDSVTGALDTGIGAEQIIAYFRQHAHPRVASNVPIVPSVVSDQIRLWQRELQRLTRARGVMYNNFETPALYRKTVEFARSIRADLLHDDSERWLVGRTEAHDQLKAEIRRLKQLFPS